MRSSRALLLFPLLGLLVATSEVRAQPPPGYYDSAAGLSGQPLRMALRDIISGHTSLMYNQLWGAFANTDVRSDGYIWDIYSDVPGGTAPYLYTVGTDQCGQYSGEGDCYNREHTFPSSWFNDAFPMYTDLFQVYPTDGYVNQKRGSLPYGVVGAIDWQSQNGTKVGDANMQGYSGTVCEPRNDFKGDIARNYFYMMTRYMDLVPGWTSDMTLNGDLTVWARYILYQWHQNDPVSAKETDRNNAVYLYQQNRNPFIDHPEWVDAIWGPTAGIGEDERPLGMTLQGDALVLLDNELMGREVIYRDLLGRVVASQRVTSLRMPLPTLPGGCYVVAIGRNSIRFVR